jgi:phage tail sheath protein FI
MTASLVIENTLPGVTVLVNEGQVARPTVRQPTSTFFPTGYAIWGPPNTVRSVTSWADYVRQFGGLDLNSHLANAVYFFYNSLPMGGKNCVISRVVGPGAAKATLTLKDRYAGVAQVETATVVGTITGNGNAKLTVTGAGIAGSPKDISVAVLANDTPSQSATKFRTALGADATVTALYAVSGATDKVILTRLAPAANDGTLNLAIANDTCTGLTAAPASANTTAGVAAGRDTLQVVAKYPSSSVDINLKIENGKAVNSAKMTVWSVKLQRKETWDDLKIEQAVIDNVNLKSKLVDFINANSVTASPDNIPALLATTPLTGGDDDFASLTDADFVGVDDGTPGGKTGLQCFNDETLDGLGGTGQVAIPGVTTDQAHAALVEHAEIYHRFAILDPPFGADKQDVIDIRENYGTWYAGLYWPWVLFRDIAGGDLPVFYPPSGFIAAACAHVDRTIGTHKAPANIQIPGALGVERASNGQSQTDDNTRELLNGKSINVITPLPEQGIKVYGARVMTGDPRIQMVHQIRMLNLFYYSLKIGYQWAVFAVVDGQGRLFRDLVATGNAFLKPYWEVGALYGKRAVDAFIVVADDSNNPPEELEAQRVHVQVGVHLSPTAEIIIVNIDNVPLFQDLGVLTQ